MLLGLADYSRGKRDRRGREGTKKKKRETWRERKKQGRRGE